MPADVIIYAVIAAGLVFWLRSILGTRHGEERERPNPYSVPEELKKGGSAGHPFPAAGRPMTAEQNIARIKSLPGSLYSIENKTAENNLLDISEKDQDFDIQFFMTAAQDVYGMVVTAFAQEDRETLQDLVSDSLYRAFDRAIAERLERGESLHTQIHAIRKLDVTEAWMEGSIAYITVRFSAEETMVHKDSEGRILSGDPDTPVAVVDIWTFARDLSGDDPRWLLVQTQSEDADDYLPDAR